MHFTIRKQFNVSFKIKITLYVFILTIWKDLVMVPSFVLPHYVNSEQQNF